jgi:uncharacterized protein YbjT (DUF2867 family)
VEMVFCDLDRPETLDAAVDGAAKIYLITLATLAQSGVAGL